MSISVIIPYFRDLPALENYLESNRKRVPTADFWVVGGEEDSSAQSLVEGLGGNWLQAERPGRGPQMNGGAEKAQGEVLLFLHADTLLPEGVEERVEEAIAKGFVGGAFARRFDSPSRFLRLTCRWADWLGRRSGWFLGDQAIFCSREVFVNLGGFADWVAFEDLDFSRRMAKRGKTTLLWPSVLSSARRFAQKGPVGQTLADFWLTLQWFGGRSFVRRKSHD
ncbi:MAG: glycosyltransferase [Opitutales bacterium]|nr:glycosyltransferase [Opitutales bacterium]